MPEIHQKFSNINFKNFLAIYNQIRFSANYRLQSIDFFQSNFESFFKYCENGFITLEAHQIQNVARPRLLRPGHAVKL